MSTNSGDATITITARDMTKAAFDAARASLKGIEQDAKVATSGLSSMSQAAGRLNTGVGGLHGSLSQFNSVLDAVGIHAGPQVAAIGEIGEASGKSTKEIGKLGTAGMIFGAAVAGWKVGRLVAEFFDLDTKIGNATAKLLGFGDVGGQVSGAKADSIALAIKRGGKAAIDAAADHDKYSVAIRVNTEWQQKFNEGAGHVAVAAKATTEAITAAWKKTQAAAEAATEAHRDAVSALAEAFSGATAIKAASDAMAAVNLNLKAGITIAKMTREQQDVLNKTLLTAINAYQSIGQVAPKAITAAYNATINWTAATKGLGAEYDKLDAILAKVRPKTLLTITTLDGATLSLTGRFAELNAALDKVDKGPKLIALTQSADDAVKEIAKLQHSIGDDFRKTFEEIPGIMARAFEDGGMRSAIRSIAAMIGKDFGTVMSDAITKQLKLGQSAFSATTIKAAAGMGTFAGIGAASSGASTGSQVGSVLSSALGAGISASAASMAAGNGAALAASAAFAAYTAGAGLAVVAAIAVYKAMNDGRKAMQEYYKTFAGGATELRTRMLILGAAGEKMWIQLTQKTGKGDKKGALAITAEITKALTEAEGIQAAISAAGFKSTDELNAAAAQAHAVWKKMSDSGKYSAEQVALAWKAVGEAEEAAASDGEKAHKDAVDAITAKYKESIGKLDTEYKSLYDSVSGEAEEAEMGIVETQQRARMAEIERQKKALEDMQAAEIATNEETYGAQIAAAQTADDEIRRIFAKPLRIPIEWDYPGDPMGAGRGSQSPAARAASGKIVIVNQTVLDGKVIAESTARQLPAVLAAYGVGARTRGPGVL